MATQSEVCRLYEGGLSAALVAQKIGRAESWVKRRLQKAGVGRSRGDAQRATFVRKGHGARWAGGRYQVGKEGKKYWMVQEPGNPRRLEHIVIAESALGRKLREGEVVHHVNGDTLDNKHRNLLVCSNSYHRSLHERMSHLYQAEHLCGECV